jgi:hypothetical protein
VSEQGGGEKKVSIGDALDAIRSGRNLSTEAKAQAGPKLPNSANFEYQRVSPSYWLENLQEGVQRSRDQLFDKIASDPKAANGMGRRDLHASEAFYVPSEWMDEVDLTKEVTVEPDVSSEITIGGVTGAVNAGTTTQSEAGRFNSTEEMNVQAYQVEEVETEDMGGGEIQVRINPMIREIFKKKAEG